MAQESTCKSENVYKGIEHSNGDIVVIYDADLTVSFKDVKFSIDILKNTNADFINCTRMIYPQKDRCYENIQFLLEIVFLQAYLVCYLRKNNRYFVWYKNIL